MTWYIIESNPQSERKAAGEIRRFGLQHGGDFRAYIPKWSRVHINTRTDTKTVKHRPLMVGYLFARFPEGYYSDLSDCQGVRRVVKNADGRPAIVPDRVIAALMRAQRQMKHEAEADRIYRMGRRRGAPASFDAAMSQALFEGATEGLVVAGPWADKQVTIVGILPNGLVNVEITMMGVTSSKALKPLVEIIPVERESMPLAKSLKAA